MRGMSNGTHPIRWGRGGAAAAGSSPGAGDDGGRRPPRDDAAPRGFILSWHEESRDRLWALADATDAIDIVGYGRDLGPTIRFLDDDPVHVVLVDLDTAPGSPAWIVSILRSVLPQGRIVVWGDDVTHFDDLFDAGVDAWISRSAEPATLAAAVTGHPSARRRP